MELLQAPLEGSAWQVLNLESNFPGNEEVVYSCKRSFKAMEAILLRERADIWAATAGLVPAPTFPAHIMHSVANMYKNGALYETYRTIPLLR